MRELFILLVLPLALAAQADWPTCLMRAPGTNPELAFVRQDVSRIPGLDEYQVCLVAPVDRDLQMEGIRVIVEGLHRNIRILSYRPLQQYVTDLNQRSGWRYGLLACEVGGMLLTISVSGDLAEIRERMPKIVIPAATGGCTLIRYVTDQQHHDVAIPPDLMQPLVFVQAGRVAEFSVWAVPQ